MMRILYFLFLLTAPALSLAQTQPENTTTSNNITTPAPEENLLDNKIYFFAHSMCQTCRGAFVYLYGHHEDLKIPITDMKFHHNFELYKQCVKKFNIPNHELRLPLICMGNHYIMGWNDDSGALFEQYLKDFQSQNNR